MAKEINTDLDKELLYAADRGNFEKLKEAVQDGANVNASDYDNETALMKSCTSGCIDSVKYLVERGADINAKDYSHATALFSASCLPNDENTFLIIKYLVENGADISITNKRKITAEKLLEWNDNKMVINFLKKQKEMNNDN